MTDKKDEISVGNALSIALLMYANEPCRICGRSISVDEVRDAVFAGYSDRFPGSRAAHKRCWEGMVDTAIAYQVKHGDLNAVDWFKEEEHNND